MIQRVCDITACGRQRSKMWNSRSDVIVMRTWMLVVCVMSSVTWSSDVFTPDDVTSPRLQRMVMDTQTGKLYVGAVNRLYQLSADLRVEAKVETGPKEDNPQCPPPCASECQCVGPNCKEFERELMNSVNKVLVIDYRGGRLIACSNLYQGHCDKHLLSDITQMDPPVRKFIVPNDETSSVVMLIGPGPPNPASTNILYVAATRSTRGLPAYKDIVPTLCMRNLHDFDLVADDILKPEIDTASEGHTLPKST